MTDNKFENLKSKFFDHADSNFSLWDKDLNCLEVNEATLKTFNLKRENLVGKHITEISPDVETSGRLEEYKKVIQTGLPFFIDEMRTHPSLGNFYFRIKVFKVGDGLGMAGKNISDLKESIEKHKNNEEKLNTIINSTDEMMHQLSMTGEIIWVNEAWKKHMGFTDEEVIGKNLFEFIDEATKLEFKKIIPLIMKGNKVDNLSCGFISKTGELIYLKGQTLPVFQNGKIIGSNAFLRNVTQLKKLEQERINLNITLEQKVIQRTAELQKSKDSLWESEKIANMGNWEVFFDTNIIRWSDNLFHLYGLKINEVEPSFEYFMSRVHPDDIHLIQNSNSVLMSEKKPVELEIRIMFPDNTIKWILDRVVPLIENDQVIGLRGIHIDISERKKAQEALANLNAELEQIVEERTKDVIKREEQYHLLLDTMREGVLYVNIEDEILFANKRFCELTEYNENEIIGKKANEIFLDEDSRKKIKIINESRKKNIRSNYEMQIRTKSGNKIWLNINGAPVQNEQGMVIGSVGTHADISVLKRHVNDLEEILFSLSHKVRQPVANILGIANLLDNKTISIEELNKTVSYMKGSVLLLDNFIKELTTLTSDMKNRT